MSERVRGSEQEQRSGPGYKELLRAVLPVVVPVWAVIGGLALSYRIHDETVDAWVQEKVYSWLFR